MVTNATGSCLAPNLNYKFFLKKTYFQHGVVVNCESDAHTHTHASMNSCILFEHCAIHGKTEGFVLRLPLHRKPRATFRQNSQSVLQAEIPQPQRTTQTSTTTHCRTQRRNRLDPETTPAATAATTRYLPLPAAATRAPNVVCFAHFDLDFCFAPHRIATFHLSSRQMQEAFGSVRFG